MSAESRPSEKPRESPPTTPNGERRILSLVFPQLLCELVRGSHLSIARDSPREKPLGVILKQGQNDEIKPTQPLTAVCPAAHRLGIRPGQSSTEANALVAGLQIEVLEEREVHEKLGCIAEVASRYGTSLCWQMPDTVWVDVSGVGHLFGGEEELAKDAQEQVRLLGHLVRAVIAPGPKIGQALGRFLERPTLVVSQCQVTNRIQELPLTALPLDAERVAWFGRLGLFSIGQLTSLPAKTLSARLGSQARNILELIQGVDHTPLVPHELPRVLSETIEWEEGVDGTSPLLFALRGLVARISARLRGRGEATNHLACELEHDRAIARQRGVLSHTLFEFELASPLYREADLERIVKSRLERSRLGAPSMKMRLIASDLHPQTMRQVGLNGSGAFQSAAHPIQEFSVLLAELQSDVGLENLGVLALEQSHLPEERSDLISFAQASGRRAKRAGSKVKQAKFRARTKGQDEFLSPCPALDRMTRLLPTPHAIGIAARVGNSFGIGSEVYTIERLRFVQRLDGVHWWTSHVARRDYFWAELKGLHGHSEALIFVERTSGEVYLQGWGD